MPIDTGDIAEVYADAKLAEHQFRWKAERGSEVMCEDALRWQRKYPDGYQTKSRHTREMKSFKKSCA